LDLNHAIWNQFRVTFVYDEQTSIYQGASWTDARAEIRRLLATDFKRYGTISDAFGNCFIVNGSRIKSVAYSENTFQMLIVFKDDSTLLCRCVTDEIGTQNYRYIKFLKASNDLANVKRNRTIKVVAQNAIQSDFIFPTFASLNENLNEGDYIIVNPGTYTMTDSFTLKNGVDIEMKEDVIVNVNYTAGTTIEHCLFSDHVTPFLLLQAAERIEIADETKRIQARIFGDATINVLDCPQNRFMPVIRNYYDSEIYLQASEVEYNNTEGALLYSFQGALTARVETATVQRLIDNDYQAAVCDLDCLDATISGPVFYPGTEVLATNPIAILRNCNVTSTSNSGIETIAQSTFVYHYINCSDLGSATWLEDTFANAGCNFYMHNAKINCDVLSAGTQVSSWYNNGFNNYTNNLIGTDTWSFYEDSLTLE
jgi:hypothetical protein